MWHDINALHMLNYTGYVETRGIFIAMLTFEQLKPIYYKEIVS